MAGREKRNTKYSSSYHVPRAQDICCCGCCCCRCCWCWGGRIKWMNDRKTDIYSKQNYARVRRILSLSLSQSLTCCDNNTWTILTLVDPTKQGAPKKRDGERESIGDGKTEIYMHALAIFFLLFGNFTFTSIRKIVPSHHIVVCSSFRIHFVVAVNICAHIRSHF